MRQQSTHHISAGRSDTTKNDDDSSRRYMGALRRNVCNYRWLLGRGQRIGLRADSDPHTVRALP